MVLYAFFVPTLKYASKAILITLVVLWVLEGGFKKKLELLSSSKFIIIFFLFFLYNYVSLFWTSQLSESLSYLNKYRYYIALPIIFTSIKKEYIKYVIYAFLIGMFISEITTYGIYFKLWSTHYNDTHLAFKNMPTAFMSHLSYSMFLAFTSFIVIIKISSKNSKILNFFLLIYLLFIIGNLLISGGRTGWLSFSVALLFYYIFFSKKNLKFFFLTATGILLFLYVAYHNVSIFEKRVTQGQDNISKIIAGDHRNSFGQRVGLIKVGIEVFKEKPIFGWGIKDNFEAIKIVTAREEFKSLAHVYNVMNSHFHIQYLIYLTQLGMFGLVIFLLIFYYLSKIKIDDDEINKTRFLFIIVFMTSLFSTELFHQTHSVHLLALFSGVFLAQNKYESINRDINNISLK